MSHSKTPPNEESAARRIAAGLARLGQIARGRVWRDADTGAPARRGAGDAAPFTPTQAQILLHLARRQRDTVRLSSLAAELGVTPPTASDSVSALIGKGMVRKGPVAGDGRGVALALTDGGHAAARDLADRPDPLADAAATLAPDEQATLLRLLVSLVRDLQERGEIPVARMCASCVYFRPYAHADAARPHHCAFVDAPFGDVGLRIDCTDHVPASPADQAALWARFKAGESGASQASSSKEGTPPT